MDNSIYNGGWLNGQKHGFGRIEYKKDFIFTGLFQDGQYHGYGCIKWNNGRQRRYFSSEGHKHGLFLEIAPYNASTSFQLFEEGDCIRQFTTEEVDRINSGDTFWHKYFKYEGSALKLVGHQTFLEPIEFLVLEAEVHTRLRTMNV